MALPSTEFGVSTARDAHGTAEGPVVDGPGTPTVRPAIDRPARRSAPWRQGATVWLTGLSGSGKSTVGSALEHILVTRGVAAYLLDGDVLRRSLNRDLGFDRDSRRENARRIAEVARLLADAGTVAVVAAISPFAADRDAARALHVASGLPFAEVFVDAPLSVCERRDPKGLYREARGGRLPSFTGVDDTYQPPPSPDVHLRTAELDVADCVATVLDHLASTWLGASPVPPRQ